MNTIVFNRKHYCFYPQLIQVVATVPKVTHATIRMQLVEQIKVHVRYKDHLRIRGCLRTLAIGRESEIARREHTRLGVLYIHIMHTRQVAHAARYHHEALVLDRPGLGTHTNPRVTVLRIRKEGTKRICIPWSAMIRESSGNSTS